MDGLGLYPGRMDKDDPTWTASLTTQRVLSREAISGITDHYSGDTTAAPKNGRQTVNHTSAPDLQNQNLPVTTTTPKAPARATTLH